MFPYKSQRNIREIYDIILLQICDYYDFSLIRATFLYVSCSTNKNFSGSAKNLSLSNSIEKHSELR